MKMIVAMSKDGVIGVDNTLPWSIPSELKMFKSYTKGKPVIMGRRTFESLPSGPLKGRTNVVVSMGMQRDTRIVTERLASRVSRYKNAIVIGGARMYDYALREGLIDEMSVTIVDKNVRGEYEESRLTYFPWSWQKLLSKYKWTTRTHFQARAGDECNYSVHNLVKRDNK